MQRRWRITEGPDYDQSLAACGVPVEHLTVHLAAFRRNLEWDPFLASRPFDGDARGVIYIKEYAADSIVLSAQYVLYKDFTVCIHRITVESLRVGTSEQPTFVEDQFSAAA